MPFRIHFFLRGSPVQTFQGNVWAVLFGCTRRHFCIAIFLALVDCFVTLAWAIEVIGSGASNSSNITQHNLLNVLQLLHTLLACSVLLLATTVMWTSEPGRTVQKEPVPESDRVRSVQ